MSLTYGWPGLTVEGENPSSQPRHHGADGAFHSGCFDSIDISSPSSEVPCGETNPQGLVLNTLHGTGSFITTIGLFDHVDLWCVYT